MLRRWWSRKYKLPWTHELFQQETEFDLLVEMLEDHFEEDPKAALEVWRGASGEIEFSDTGDDLIDKWERELAMGLEPDLTEGISEATRKQLEKEQRRGALAKKAAGELDGLVENYEDPRYASKKVIPGSTEDKELRMAKAMRGARMPAGFDPKLLLGSD